MADERTAARPETAEFYCDECGSRDACYCDDIEGDDLACTHCGGDGTCEDNADPLWDCDDLPHACHACGGTGNRRDQVIF